jgi:hypothetical protein
MADQMTWGRLDQLIQRADARNQSFHSTVKVMRGHRFRTRPVDIPAEYKKTSQEFRSPLPFDQIQRVVAALTGDTTDRPITVRVVPRTEDDEERHNTTIKEKFIVSMMDAMDKDKHDSVWQMGIDAAVGDGKGIIHLRYHPGAYSAKSGFPQIKNFNELGDEDQNLAKWQAAVFQFKKSSRLPMSWENVDVLNYLPIMAPGGKRTAVIEAHHLDIEVLGEMFPKSVAFNDQGDLQTEDGTTVQVVIETDEADNLTGVSHATMFTYTDENYWSVWVPGSTIGTQGAESTGIKLDGGVNPFKPIIPYFEFHGLPTSSNRPEEHYLSILFPASDLYDSINAELTKWSNVSTMYGFPAWKRKGSVLPEGEDLDDTGEKETFEAGKIHNLLVGGDIAPIIPPNLGGLSEQLLGIFLSMESQVGMSAITRGQGLGADASGFLLSQLEAAAQGLYRPIQNSIERGLSEIAHAILWLVAKKMPQGMVVQTEDEAENVEWLTMTKEIIDGYFNAAARLRPMLPSAFAANVGVAAQAVAAELLDPETAREKLLDDPHPEETDRRIRVSKVKNSREYMQILIQEFLRRRGVGLEAPPAENGVLPQGGGPETGPNVRGMPAQAEGGRRLVG